MEIHHHTETERKKWTHYLFEFFMLFLAVFCGYLAEWKLEHNIERGREKGLMRAMLSDLNSDVKQIDSLKIRREIRNRHCDSLIFLLTASSAIQDSGSLIYYYGRNASRRIHFRPQDGILKQLRTSGGFRTLHDVDTRDGINAYELLLQSNLENIEVEEKELSEYTQQAAKIFDVRVFQDMTKNNMVERVPGNPSLLTYDRLLLNELCVRLHYWKRTSISARESLDSLRANATRLIEAIRENYHLQ